MTETDVSALRGRTLRSFLLLGAQRGVSLVVGAAGGIALARLLTPEIFGLYAVLAFAVALGVTLSDLGLGAALIQRRDLDPARVLGPAFTLTLGLGLVLALALLALAPVLAPRLGASDDVALPLACLAALVVLSTLRMPAAVLLERGMRYLPLTVAETLETLVFHSVAIGAALTGAGLWSFVLGAVAGRLVNVLLVTRAAGWRPRLAWRWEGLGPALRFGVLFQGSALVTTARDAIVPTLVVAWSGVAAAGFLNWAATLAFQALQVVSVAGRVLFPALSRLQDDPKRFGEAAERALNRVAALLYPAALLLLAGAEPIVGLVYGEAWLPAVPALRLFCVTALLGGTSTILVHALYSLGRADLVFWLNVGWTALLWGLSAVLVPWLGFVGYALASVGLSTTGVVPAYILGRLVPLRMVTAVRVPLAAATVAALLLAVLAEVWIHDLPPLAAAAAAAGGAYVGLALALGGSAWRDEFLADWRTVLRV